MGRSTYVFRAELRLDDATDPRAPGGAVTTALCGHWEHEGACRWPHNNAIDPASAPAHFRTVFVADDADAEAVHAQIDSALRSATGWSVISAGAGTPHGAELSLGSRLASGTD